MDMVTSMSPAIRHRILLLAAVLTLVLLAACGGSGSDAPEAPEGSAVPVVAGAQQLASDDKGDLFDSFGYATSTGMGTVYRSTTAYDEVTSFYGEGIKSEGWDVLASQQFLPGSWTVIATKGDVVTMLTIMQGSAYQQMPSLAGLDAYDIDPASIAASDTLVVVAEFTCEEQHVRDCTTVGG
jgi:hypothetical protein